jgi:hypothetical protein
LTNPRQYHNSLVLIDLVRDILNNLIFVVLGVMIVRIVRADLLVANNVDLRWLAAGFLIYLVTLAVRFAYGVLVKMGPRGGVIFALGGVHGAITLALAFSIAASLTDQQFQFVVLTETMLVLLSMLVPSVVFGLFCSPTFQKEQSRIALGSCEGKWCGKELPRLIRSISRIIFGSVFFMIYATKKGSRRCVTSGSSGRLATITMSLRPKNAI